MSVELGDLGEKEIDRLGRGWEGGGVGGWRGEGSGVRRGGGGGAWCSEGGFLGPAEIKRCDRGEGGVVSQVVMVIGQLTKCKDLFWSIASCLDAKGEIKPKLDFLGS